MSVIKKLLVSVITLASVLMATKQLINVTYKAEAQPVSSPDGGCTST